MSGSGLFLISDGSANIDIDKLQWFEQARDLGAHAIYFVANNPTVLFFTVEDYDVHQTVQVEEVIRDIHLRVWNASRIPLFFVLLPFEVRVYSAYQKPVRSTAEWNASRRSLDNLEWPSLFSNIADALSVYNEYNRASVESGELFTKRPYDFDRENRVDRFLLRNLRLLRQRLQGEDSRKKDYVHALISRAIFIRYLEDRDVLVQDYFADINPKYRGFIDILESKDDTYNVLFPKLRKEFNGDLFPYDEQEIEYVTEDDLLLLRDFLLGREIGGQVDVFFWAYKFDIIPVELISSIYEEFFYEMDDLGSNDTHYTPLPLVEFVLSQTLTIKRLENNPKILDPACGSGVFLVEAFKRIVRYECKKRGLKVDRLPRKDLTQLLTRRIVGIDINKQAVQVAAFSLYLAFLDSLEPKDIRQHKQLPNLIHNSNGTRSGTTLYIANAFWLTEIEKQRLKRKLDKKAYGGRAEDVRLVNYDSLPLRLHSFDVIVGNPPWGSNATEATKIATRWCNAFDLPVGYKELSQCFIWRCRSLSRKGGVIGLLVSSGVMLKNEDKSKDFRRHWLSSCSISSVYDFSHVRQFFFRKQKAEAIAPFAAVFYGLADIKASEAAPHRILYISVKRTIFAEQLQAVVIDKTNFNLVNQRDFVARDWLWKTYMWGNVRDAELVEDLKADYPPMRELVVDGGRGFGDLAGKHDTIELGVSLEMLDRYFDKDVTYSRLIVPIAARRIRRVGKLDLYKGQRIIVRRGVARSGHRNGEIQAKLFSDDFAFTDNFIGISVDNLTGEQQQILLGIMQSSLAKYYHFLTCSMWGLWHFKIHADEHLDFPIAFPENTDLSNRIISAMMELPFGISAGPLFEDADWRSNQTRLDNAVFDLYELSERQRDLVKDLCDTVLDFFYAGAKSDAVKPPSFDELELYRQAFLELWDKRLPNHNKYLETTIYAPSNGLMCGFAFQLKDGDQISSKISSNIGEDDREMRDLFRKLGTALRERVSRDIYTERILKVLTDNAMCIVKRAEKRYWTRSQARQDASELLTEVFSQEWQRARG